MVEIYDLKDKYLSIDKELSWHGEEAIMPQVLLSFPYEYPKQPSTIVITTDEFTAVCPWTGLPDYGTLEISYTPFEQIIELKSLKYYLLSFRDVGIVQEHVANRILQDMVELITPQYIRLVLNYKARGGLQTSVTVEWPNN